MARRAALLVLITSPAAGASYRGECTDAASTSVVRAPGWLQQPSGHHQLAVKGCPNATLQPPRFALAPNCSQTEASYAGCIAHPMSDSMGTWAVPSPATGGMAFAPPRCANGVCNIGVPASAPSLNPIAGIMASGLTSGDFVVHDTTQSSMDGVTGMIVAATWADFDNDGACAERGDTRRCREEPAPPPHTRRAAP